MPDFHSYLEPINSGVYITHAHNVGDRSLCGLVIYDLIPSERVTVYNRTSPCARCLAIVLDAVWTPRTQSEQLELLPQAMEGNDG